MVRGVGAGGDGSQRDGPTLAERALELRLAPQRLVALSARGARGGERAFAAARNAPETDRGAEIE